MYNLSNHTEPVKQLDKVHPKWRDEFPMPLDDETGTRFLNGLLCTASVEAKSHLQKIRVPVVNSIGRKTIPIKSRR
jgi:hypothetical protein